MGILNVSDDSFSDGGKYSDVAAALSHAKLMLQDGADIIDIGAESTRPNAALLPADAEIARLVPALNALRAEMPDTPISVDTYKPEVARIAVDLGADIINDVCANIIGGEYPMARVAADKNCPLIITHNCRGKSIEGDFFEFFMRGISDLLQKALEAGLKKNQIVLDPGFGFGKTSSQNFELVRRLGELREFGCAVLLGVSRKSSLAEAVGCDMSSRDDATSIISAFAALSKSADILRVHDVRKDLNAVKIAGKLMF